MFCLLCKFKKTKNKNSIFVMLTYIKKKKFVTLRDKKEMIVKEANHQSSIKK